MLGGGGAAAAAMLRTVATRVCGGRCGPGGGQAGEQQEEEEGDASHCDCGGDVRAVLCQWECTALAGGRGGVCVCTCDKRRGRRGVSGAGKEAE